MEDFIRITFRLSRNNPRHKRIIQILSDLNREIYPTKTRFIVEALDSYIEGIMSDEATNVGKQREESQKKKYISREEYERDKISLREDIRRGLYEDMLKVMSSVVLSRAGVTEQIAFPAMEGRGVAPPGGSEEKQEVDLTQYEDIMKDIAAWAED